MVQGCHSRPCHLNVHVFPCRSNIHQGVEDCERNKGQQELADQLDFTLFLQAVVEVYKSTQASGRGLRDLAMEMTLIHTEMRTSNEKENLPFPDSLAKLVPQFSSDLLLAVMHREFPPPCILCPRRLQYCSSLDAVIHTFPTNRVFVQVTSGVM